MKYQAIVIRKKFYFAQLKGNPFIWHALNPRTLEVVGERDFSGH